MFLLWLDLSEIFSQQNIVQISRFSKWMFGYSAQFTQGQKQVCPLLFITSTAAPYTDASIITTREEETRIASYNAMSPSCLITNREHMVTETTYLLFRVTGPMYSKIGSFPQDFVYTNLITLANTIINASTHLH